MSDHGTDPDADIDADTDVGTGGRKPSVSKRRKQVASRWVRWVHVYTSMISLLVVLFFGITGITLNHPDWTFGDSTSTAVYSGTLPAGWDAAAQGNSIDFLKVSEFVRNNYDVKGAVDEYSATSTDGLISFKAPGYAAELTFQVPSGTFSLTVVQQGFVAVMNDIHKGRDTDSSWGWVIDLSGGFLVLVAVSGLGIQLFQRKRRRSALLITVGATVITVVLIVISMR